MNIKILSKAEEMEFFLNVTLGVEWAVNWSQLYMGYIHLPKY